MSLYHIKQNQFVRLTGTCVIGVLNLVTVWRVKYAMISEVSFRECRGYFSQPPSPPPGPTPLDMILPPLEKRPCNPPALDDN